MDSTFERFGAVTRLGLYLAFMLWSILLFFLCIARINYTDHRRNESSLNGGAPFYGAFFVNNVTGSNRLSRSICGGITGVFYAGNGLWRRNVSPTFTEYAQTHLFQVTQSLVPQISSFPLDQCV